MADSYHLTFLRHGESVANAAGRWQGQQDSPLNTHGKLQARLLADRWHHEARQFDEVFSSPLARARETAEIIASRLQMEVRLDPVWLERDNGVFAGTSRSQQPFEGPANIYEPVGEHGESLNDLHMRAGRALDTIFSRSPGAYLIVAHGGILNQVLCYAMGIPPQPRAAGVRFAFGNTGFATLEFTPASSRWMVRGINDLLHLEARESQSIWQG